MTTTQVVETSVTNNSLSKDYPHPDGRAKQITDTPGFKPFTISDDSKVASNFVMVEGSLSHLVISGGSGIYNKLHLER